MLYSQNTTAVMSRLKEEDYSIMRKHQLEIEQLLSEHQNNKISYNIFNRLQPITEQVQNIINFIEKVMENYSCLDEDNRSSSLMYAEAVTHACQTTLNVNQAIFDICQKMFIEYQEQIEQIYQAANKDNNLLVLSYYFGSTQDQELPISSEHLNKIRTYSQKVEEQYFQNLLEELYNNLSKDILSLQENYCLLKRKLISISQDIKRLYNKLSDDE